MTKVKKWRFRYYYDIRGLIKSQPIRLRRSKLAILPEIKATQEVLSYRPILPSLFLLSLIDSAEKEVSSTLSGVGTEFTSLFISSSYFFSDNDGVIEVVECGAGYLSLDVDDGV